MVHVNGKKVGGNDNVCKFTAYVSPYFVVSNGGAYTKHIYAANQRIASKLGNVDGFGADPRRVEMAGGKKYDDIQKDNIGARFSELGFTFNAKELDNETGLYYYGARYLDPTGAMWLSVDPLFEKYAGMSPYNYCQNNPIKFIDPDGRDGEVEGSGTKKDPYVVTAEYFYVRGTEKENGLSDDAIAGLKEAVNSYNHRGEKWKYRDEKSK